LGKILPYRFFRRKIFPILRLTPARFHVAIWSIIFCAIWLTGSQYHEILSVISTFKRITSIQIPPAITITPTQQDLIIIIKVALSILFGILAHFGIKSIILADLNFFTDTRRDREAINELIRTLDEKSGIERIFNGVKEIPAIHQKYALDIMSEIKKTTSIKLLSIAGYENIGKGESRSLLYDYIRSNPNIDVEAIVLNPDCKNVCEERVNQLRHSCPNYTIEKMIYEINETLIKLKMLNDSRKGTSSKMNNYIYNYHPIFRLIIFDHCLYLSTYERNLHGHESPVYKIINISENDINRSSLYASYLNYYNKIKSLSNEFFPIISTLQF
jgi:hypothetical protein